LRLEDELALAENALDVGTVFDFEVSDFEVSLPAGAAGLSVLADDGVLDDDSAFACGCAAGGDDLLVAGGTSSGRASAGFVSSGFVSNGLVSPARGVVVVAGGLFSAWGETLSDGEPELVVGVLWLNAWVAIAVAAMSKPSSSVFRITGFLASRVRSAIQRTV